MTPKKTSGYLLSAILLASQTLGAAGSVSAAPSASSSTGEASTVTSATYESSVTGATYGADLLAPSAPASLTVTAKTANSVSLSWSDAADNVKVAGYEVYRGGVKIASVSGTSYTAVGLAANTSYTFTVKAKDAAGNLSPASPSQTVTTAAAQLKALAAGESLFETETLTQRDSGDTTTPYTDAAASGGQWELYNANAVNDYVEYDISVPQAGTYAIKGLVRVGNNRGIIQASVDGKNQGSPVDTFTGSAAFAEKDFGSVTFAAGGTHKVRFTVTGKNAKSLDYRIGTDAIKLVSAAAADTIAPAAPAGLTSSAKTDTTVTLNWTASTDNVGVIGYDVFNGTVKVATVSGTTHVVSGLAASTSYTFTVKAKDAAGNSSAASNALAVTTNPAAAGGKTFEVESQPQADSGDASTIMDDAAASGGQWENYAANAAGDYVEYALNVPTAGAYTVQLRAKGGVDRGKAQLYIDGTAQGTPIDFYKTSAQSGFADYSAGSVYFSTPGFKIFRLAVTGKNASSTGYSLPLDAIKLLTVADSTPPTVPADLTVTGRTSSSVSLSWSASTDNVQVAGYDIYNGSVKAGTTTDTSFTVSGLAANSSYTFTVKARDAAGNASAASTAVTAVTPAPLGAVTLPVTMGSQSSLYIRSDGSVWGWGYNGYGQLGNGTSNNSSIPVKAINLANMKLMAGGEYHSLGLRSDGTLYAWGYNGYGQLGDDSTTSRYSPVQVTTASSFTSIAAGEYFSLALKSDGTVWSFGRNNEGQLGDGTTSSQRLPVQVKDLGSVTSIAAGANFSLALKSDGTVWSWGSNSYGELGTGQSGRSTAPAQVAHLTGVKAIAAGDYHGVALKNDGTVWAWGYNNSGELGNASTINQATPVQVGITGVKSIAAGSYHNLAVKQDGSIWSWGYNGYGQLGSGTTTNRTTPAQIPGLSSIASVSAGEYYSTALGTNGILYAWGRNGYGQTGSGTTMDSYVPLKAIGPDVNPADTSAPTAVTDLRLNSQGVRSLTLAWSRAADDVGVSSYEIYNGSVLLASVAPGTTSHTLSGLPLNTTFQLTVRAKDASGNQAAASNVLTATTSDKTPPAVPKDLTLLGVTSSTVSLMWTASSDNDLVKQYNIYAGTTRVGSTASTSFTVTGLTGKTPYVLTVKAEDDAGNESAASAALNVTTE